MNKGLKVAHTNFKEVLEWLRAASGCTHLYTIRHQPETDNMTRLCPDILCKPPPRFVQICKLWLQFSRESQA
jgi:hypothetical protein